MVDEVVVVPGCETTGSSGTEVHLSHILRTFLGSFANWPGGVGSCGGWWIVGQSYTTCSTVSSVPGGVGSCGGWWIVGQSYTTCSIVSSPIPHFLHMVSTARPILCSQYLSSWWWPLLGRPIVVCTFLDSLIHLCGQAFLLSHKKTWQILNGGMSDGGLRRVVVVLNILIGHIFF